MATNNKSLQKGELTVNISSSGEKDIKQILKEILLKKARHICISHSADVE